jgi:hypothetical protein
LPSCDVLGYGRDLDLAAAVLPRHGRVHHFDIFVFLFFVFVVVFSYVLQIEVGERSPD